MAAAFRSVDSDARWRIASAVPALGRMEAGNGPRFELCEAMASASPSCDACARKSHVPMSRLRRVEVREQGPAFLHACGSCGSL
jgi:hypothetical protein